MIEYEIVVELLEAAHSRFQSALKEELDRFGYGQLTATQAMMLYRLGREGRAVPIKALYKFYFGSNSSYNINKLRMLGLVTYTRSTSDARVFFVELSETGAKVRGTIEEIFARRAAQLPEGLAHNLPTLNRMLRSFQRAAEGNRNTGGFVSEARRP